MSENTPESTKDSGSATSSETKSFSEKYSEDQLPELRDILGREARFWIDRIHGETMVRTAGPDRMVHLQQIRENDTHLADLSRELKKTMKEPSRG